MPNFEISATAEMIASLDPRGSDPAFVQGVAAGLADLGSTTSEWRILAFAGGFMAGQAAQAEADAQPRPDAEAHAATIRQAERRRIAAILALGEAKGREASALHLAMTTDLPADAIAATLATLPSPQPASRWPAPRQPVGLSPRLDGPRSRDAAGGLVTFDPETGQAGGGAAVAFAPCNPLEGSGPAKRDAKSVWSGVVAGLNAGGDDAAVR